MSTAETDEDKVPAEEDADEVADEAPAEDESPGGDEPKRRNGAFVLVSIAAGVFALLAIVMVAIVVKDHPSNGDTNGDRTEISTTAARVAEAITAVDPNGNGTLAATVEQFGTAPVISQYNEISDAMRQVMGPLKLQSIRGTVKEVYVGSIDGSEAKVIIRLDLVYVGANTRAIPDQYLDMSLAKLDGAWKVDNVQVLNVALAGGSSSTIPCAAPTTSSIPASSG